VDNPLSVEYHDEEWGVSRPLTDDEELELLSLEVFQAGLSWELILNRREHFRKAFRGFALDTVARMGGRDVRRLLGDPGIIRNRAKIEATIRNARAMKKVIVETGNFAAFLSPFLSSRRRKGVTGPPPPFTKESIALSRALKAKGFSFVGPTVVYSFLQATGRVNDHEPGCFLNDP
jgi:DNA-3-methyladenine glycosylase I